MDRAIYELKLIMKRHNKQRQEYLDIVKGDAFKLSVAEPVEENISFIIKHTNNIYDDYIGRLQKAIGVLERVGDSRRKRYRRRYK
jgi:hypothetical protein